MKTTAEPSLFLPADGGCLPQGNADDADLAFEQRLRRRTADALAIELEIQAARLVITRDLLRVHAGRIAEECDRATV
jgi:hypothetical protein